MGLRINTNIAAMNAHRNLAISDSNMAKSLERLSSGYRINRAADDAAGLSISSKLSVQARSQTVASRNTAQANSMLQVAEGGMDQISNMIERLKELATQAASANNASNRSDIDEEAAALINEIDRIANSTTFQGTSLLTGFGGITSDADLSAVENVYDFSVDNAGAGTYTASYDADTDTMTLTRDSDSTTQTFTFAGGAETVNFTSLGISIETTEAFAADVDGLALATAINGMTVSQNDATFQVGETNDANYRLGFQIASVLTTDLGIDGINLTTLTGAQTAMTNIDSALTTLNTERGKIGAVQNRLSYTAANLATSIENVSAAASVIKDVDMAAEMTTFTKNQILTQAGTSMLAQANMAPQQVLSLLG
ncbi:MAG: flagellin [Deltaproteobacteria bacterium]|nr:flagellin [Deltaproteobacteria bacterium]